MKLFSFLSKEKRDVPIIYQLGWWAHQQVLEVTSFEVTVVKSNLNLFNSISLIRYTVKGWLHHRAGGVPYIRSIHHSEQLIPAPNEFLDEMEENELRIHAHIQLTPVVAFKDIKKRLTERVPFEFSNEYRIKSLRWGQNSFKISCAGIDHYIRLSQRK